jgi:hypothetical protein
VRREGEAAAAPVARESEMVAIIVVGVGIITTLMS